MRQRILRRMKQLEGCVDCGYNENPDALEFDHIELVHSPRRKNIRTSSWEFTLNELDKCVVRCANCHRIRTHNQRRKGWN